MIAKLAGALILVVFAGAAAAQPALTIDGQVNTPLQLSVADLQAMPSGEAAVSYTTGHHGEQHGTFKGALLWSVLGKAGVKDGDAKGAHLRHGIVVSGRDGYAVLIAMGEIDPEFEGKPVLVAYEKDQKAIENGVKLIVPGDHKGGRNVFDVVRIEVQ
jgi:hypothetical protein